MSKPRSREDVRSDEEWRMVRWLQECVRYYLVEDWEYEPEVFTLFDSQHYFEEKKLKTKVKTVEKHLHREETYTPDFRIDPTDLGRRLFANAGVFKKAVGAIYPLHCPVWIDVKGSYNPYQNDQQLFSMKQKAMYARHKIWVEKVVPFEKKVKGSLFINTFAPEEFRWMKNRKAPTLSVCGKMCPSAEEFVMQNPCCLKAPDVRASSFRK